MLKLKFSTFILLAFWNSCVFSQQKQYKVICVGFYNTENFYDTINDPKTADEEFLPNGPYHYNTAVYTEKLSHLAEVIAQIGKDESPDGLAILGLAEVENEAVLHDLTVQTSIADRHYSIVHYDSPDDRGIDVALLYNPKYFRHLHGEPLFVGLRNPDGTPKHTRDILWVYGLLDGEPVHMFINHWPSRRGGSEASAQYRAVTASICRHMVDSIESADTLARIIIMGDLNDDPIDSSVAKVLKAQGNATKVKPADLYNPMLDIFKAGTGSLKYNDAWNLFDQIIFSGNFLTKTQKNIFFSEAHVFNKAFLITNTGKYKGYPYRSYSGTYYIHGYSDHLPVYAVLLKEALSSKKTH